MKNIIETNIKVNRTIEMEEIDKTDFIFYVDTKNIDTNGKIETQIIKGITSKENLKLVKGLDKINNIIYAPKMYKNAAIVMAIKKDNFKLVLSGKKYINEIIEEPNKIEYPIPENYMLVLWNWLSYTIMDLNYNFISIPISFGYSANVDNECYDLDKLLKKLKCDKNVIDKENLSITDIPYYNVDGDKDRSIEFNYLLPNDIYENIIGMSYFKSREYILKRIIGADECKK